MRKIITNIVLALATASPAMASGPKMSAAGGIGSVASTYASGEPSGGTYAINGSTATGSFPVVNMRPGTAPGSPNNGDCWVTAPTGTVAYGMFCQINGSPVGPFFYTREPGQFLTAGQTIAQLTTGAIDASVAINAAISGGNVFLQIPCGYYRIDHPIHITSSSTRISARQNGCVQLAQNFTSGSGIQVDGGATAGISNVIVDHMLVAMYPGVTKASGSSFHANNAHGVYFSYDGSVGDFTGFELFGGVVQFTYMVDHSEIINAMNSGIRLSDDGTAENQVKDVYLSNNSIGGSGNGMLLQNSSGVYAMNMDICCHGGTGILFAPSSGQNINATFMANVLADEQTSGNGAWAFANTGGFVTETYLTNCWGSGSTAGPGLLVENPKVNVLHISGFDAHSNWNAGIDIENGTNITIDGAHASYNSLSGANAAPGILIQGATSHLTLVNNFMGKSGFVQEQDPSQVNNQNYGFIIAGSASYVIASLNQTFNNGIAGFMDISSNSSTNLKVNNLSQ